MDLLIISVFWIELNLRDFGKRMDMQTQGQPPGINGSSHSSSSPAVELRTRWQTDGDVSDRRIVLEHIMRLFQKRKSHVTPEWQQKLPDFVKRLEDHLYRDATSKDEYKDLNTLEPRLQAVARRMATARNTTTMQRPSTSSAMRAMAPAPRGIPAMIPTPGARSSTMIPTPGMPTDAASAVTTQYPRCSSNGISVPVSASATGASNSYIPQQGLRMVQNGQRPTGPTAAAAMNENGHNYHHQTASVSGKRNPPFVNNRVDSGFIGNGQHSLGVNIGHPSSGFLGQVQAQTQHHVSHMQCDGYLLEAARGQMQKSSMNGNISNGQVSKMIPVPGLPSQVLQQLQSENAQERNSISRTNQTKSGISRQQNTATEQPKQEEDQLTSSIPQCSQGGDGEAASGIGSGQSASLQQKAQQYTKQQKWLLLLRHASKCASSEGQCVYSPACSTVRQLCNHISWCRERTCQFPRCQGTRILLRHHSSCKDARCPVCAPVRLQLAQQRQALQASSAGGGGGGVNGHSSAALSSSVNDGKNSSGKRIKEEADDSLPLKNGVADTTTGEGVAPPAVKKIKTENCYVKSKSQGGDVEGLPVTHLVKTEAENVLSEHSATGCGLSLVKQEALTNNGDKSAKPKNVGISLIELFSPEQIKDHIVSLRQWIGQSKAKAEKNQALEQQKSENACRLCAVERLTFEPPPLYCTTCGGRIKRNVAYYTAGLGETKHFFCVPCFNEIRTDTVELDGQAYPKNKLERKKNDEEMEEAWVQCDKCNLWQHQICALFNGRRNEGGDAEYICPHCCLIEMEKSERKPLPSSSVLGAKDLPKTILSDHLEQRLARRLKQERLERARAAGKGVDEVPGAEGLVIRVVSSVDKKLEVKQRFLELFQGSECPTEFAYKSKVVLLFQKIEGVEVCLFGMYVQEFGAECSQPNNRRVYLSYLDSVKYFRPEVRTVNGEALRTFVYHEILIGYLEYCKKRGFGSCYIWACPPLRGEDYILYCHPEIQKTPKSDKLREWYLTMLRKASADKIVAEVTNFYDYFFVSPDECTADVTAARLPYFDGDYWPGAAEDMLAQLQNEEDEERKLQKKGKGKKVKRAAQSDINSSSSKDLQLMHKLGQTILPMKEDFIMVHIHHTCRRCRLFITSGHRWVCKQCKNYQMCNRCYIADQKLEERDRHPSNSWEAHTFVAVEIEEVAADTKDKDDIMESEFFDTRQAFLSLCQGNHYQHDTLRRAKHSSMMVLYHLHNPTAPAFVTSCNICQIEIETGRGWRCDTCPDFDVCDACHQKDDSSHPHKLTPQLSVAERSAQNKEARQQRVLQLRKMLGLLVHASQCCAPQCQYPKCRSVKGLFRHGTVCRTRASGGCALCKMMWHLLQLHARACKESDCRVPRCKDLKEHLRRLQQQMESRRRAAVKEMIRQRTSGGSSSNG